MIEGLDVVSEFKFVIVGEKDCGLRFIFVNFGGNEIFLEDGCIMGRMVFMVKVCYDDGI